MHHARAQAADAGDARIALCCGFEKAERPANKIKDVISRTTKKMCAKASRGALFTIHMVTITEEVGDAASTARASRGRTGFGAMGRSRDAPLKQVNQGETRPK